MTINFTRLGAELPVATNTSIIFTVSTFKGIYALKILSGVNIKDFHERTFFSLPGRYLIMTEDELKILILTGWGGSLFAQTLK